LVIVPALRLALPFDCADLSQSNAHLFHVLFEPSRHTNFLAKHSVIALQLPCSVNNIRIWVNLNVAEVILSHAHLLHDVIELLLIMFPLYTTPTGEFGIGPNSTVFLVAGVHPERTTFLAHAVWYIQHLTALRGICPAGDC